MLGQLAEAGCLVCADDDEADVAVVNTCGFLEASRTEADEIIRDLVARKSAGGLKRVVVAGCLVQRDKQAILDRIPGVDALVGVNNRDDVVRAVLGGANGANSRTTDVYLADYHPFIQIDTARLRLTPRHYAYLRISEGCDQKCTFCTIPSIRGRMHCKPPGVILDEARELIDDGAVEISLIGQDTTSYGLGEDRIDSGLAGLLRLLDRVAGLRWLRLMYVYPSVFTDEMIDAIAECERVCKYIDIPLQHINDRMLKAMHRRVDRATTERLLQRIRDRIPGVSIRTTLIAGFPGETEAEFNELLEFVTAFRFDALGVFPYSLEPETPAGRMNGQLSDAEKKDRVEALMAAQQQVAFAIGAERIGQRFDVLVDEVVEEAGEAHSSPASPPGNARFYPASPGVVSGRHQGQAPLVDGVTFIEGCNAKPGEFVSVRCTGQNGYDLVATPTRRALRVLGA